MRKLSEEEQKLFNEFSAERRALRKHLPKIIQGKIEAREFKLGNKPKQEGWYFVMHFGSVANQIYMDDAYWDNEKWHGFKNEEIFAYYIPIDEEINEIVPELYADFTDDELFGKSFEEKEFKLGDPENEGYYLTIRKGLSGFYTEFNRFINGNWDINFCDGSKTFAYIKWNIPALDKLNEVV